MSQNIYTLFQDIFPELAQQDLPEDLEQFTIFDDWLNQTHSYLQYVEIKEFDNNEIKYSRVLQQNNVDVVRLQQDIVSQVEDYFLSFDEDEDEDLDLEARIEMDEKVEEILFDTIKQYAEQHQLQLLVIARENPYWMVLPQQNAQTLDEIVSCFNQTFNRGGDLNMVIY